MCASTAVFSTCTVLDNDYLLRLLLRSILSAQFRPEASVPFDQSMEDELLSSSDCTSNLDLDSSRPFAKNGSSEDAVRGRDKGLPALPKVEHKRPKQHTVGDRVEDEKEKLEVEYMTLAEGSVTATPAPSTTNCTVTTASTFAVPAPRRRSNQPSVQRRRRNRKVLAKLIPHPELASPPVIKRRRKTSRPPSGRAGFKLPKDVPGFQ